jgi:hypothetical protein
MGCCSAVSLLVTRSRECRSRAALDAYGLELTKRRFGRRGPALEQQHDNGDADEHHADKHGNFVRRNHY